MVAPGRSTLVSFLLPSRPPCVLLRRFSLKYLVTQEERQETHTCVSLPLRGSLLLRHFSPGSLVVRRSYAGVEGGERSHLYSVQSPRGSLAFILMSQDF